MYSIADIARFMLSNCPWKTGSLDETKEIIRKHIEYGTIIVLNDKVGITALVRFNQEGRTAKVLDCVIRKDKRSYGFIKQLLKYGMKKYNLSKLVWERVKYPNRNKKEYKG